MAAAETPYDKGSIERHVDATTDAVDSASTTGSATSARHSHDQRIDVNDNARVDNDRPYSVFTKGQKWVIVALVSLAAVFSPLTSSIYLPAIPTLSRVFGKSTELINLTVTLYMVFQGISPMVWGPLADRKGRRPVVLACLLTLALSCIGLALVPTNAYWLLMLLRCLQAAGSASTIALCSGVIGDIATSDERGGFFGVSGVGSLIGPAIGPVIGGALAEALGWRSIFWFLCICSSICFVFLFLVLPETLRAIVGDGSITPAAFYRPPLPFITGSAPSSSTAKPPKKPFINPFLLFTYPDVVTLLVFNGLVNAVFYGVLASISSLFARTYPFLSETDIGLCFLSVGGGMIVGSLINGRLLDREYRITKENLVRALKERREDAISDEDAAREVTHADVFPIEMARLRSSPIYLLVLAACNVGYGWSLQKKASIAVPLVLQFIIGYATVAFMNTSQTLLVDLMPSRGSSVTAASNLIRCSLGAVTVSVMDLIINAIGEGWAYVVLGGICIVNMPLIWLEIRMGPFWRAQRRERERRQDEKRVLSAVDA